MDSKIIDSFKDNNKIYSTTHDARECFRDRLGSKVDSFWGVLPVSFLDIEFGNFDYYNYLYAEKKDGVRALLYCNNNIYTFQFRDNTVQSYKLSYVGGRAVMDVEILNNSIVILDCLYCDDIGSTFEERQGDVNVFCRSNKKFGQYIIERQCYFGADYFKRKVQFSGEGIIIVRRSSYVDDKFNSIYKWKIPERCTIDLEVYDNEGFTSDGHKIIDKKCPDGVWEFSCNGEIIGERKKDVGNSRATVINVFKNFHINYDKFIAKIFGGEAYDFHLSIDEIVLLINKKELEVIKLVEKEITFSDEYKLVNVALNTSHDTDCIGKNESIVENDVKLREIVTFNDDRALCVNEDDKDKSVVSYVPSQVIRDQVMLSLGCCRNGLDKYGDLRQYAFICDDKNGRMYFQRGNTIVMLPEKLRNFREVVMYITKLIRRYHYDKEKYLISIGCLVLNGVMRLRYDVFISIVRAFTFNNDDLGLFLEEFVKKDYMILVPWNENLYCRKGGTWFVDRIFKGVKIKG